MYWDEHLLLRILREGVKVLKPAWLLGWWRRGILTSRICQGYPLDKSGCGVLFLQVEVLSGRGRPENGVLEGGGRTIHERCTEGYAEVRQEQHRDRQDVQGIHG